MALAEREERRSWWSRVKRSLHKALHGTECSRGESRRRLEDAIDDLDQTLLEVNGRTQIRRRDVDR